MANGLRPDLRIEQKFVTETPIVLESVLAVNISGVSRQLEWRGDAGEFIGGQLNDPYSFPNLIDGSIVELDTVVDEILRPHVFISNRFGVAEVSPSYNWSQDPPTFDLAPTLSAVFEISDGSTGDYAASSGKFIDANADFIEDEVAAGDVILINGVPSLTVTALISDDELDVAKIDKGGQTYSGDLSAASVNGDRTLTDSAYDFIAAGVKVGDLVEVNHWDIISQADGIEYSAETLGVRNITSDVDYGFAAAGVQPPISGPPYQVDVVWIKDSGGDWTPAFKVSANVTSTSFDAVNLITAPAWPGPTDTEENKVFEIYHYTAVDLTGGGVWTDVNGDWTADGTPIAGQRTFTIGGGNPNGIDFSTLLVLPLSRYSIAVHGINDAGGTTNARPIFKIVSITGFPAPSTTLVVENWDPDRPQGSATGTGTTWEIWDDGGAPIVSFLGSDITVEGGGGAPAGERTLTSTYNDFSAAGENVAVGDVVYSDTGVALFVVTGDTVTTGNINKIYVENIIPGNPAPGWSDSEFGFYIGANNPVNLKVTQVVDENTLTIRNILSDPPSAGSWTDLYYTIEIQDTLDNVSYTIEKTVSGSNLSGDVLVTYTARRTDRIDGPVEVTEKNRLDLVGPAVPANPLGLACKIALENSNYSVWATQVEDDTDSSWDMAIQKGKNEKYYVLCPLTQDESVLSAFRTHIALESDPDTKRERVLYQCHLFERIEDRTEDQSGDNAQYVKTSTTTTITVLRDLSAYGVIVGDVFHGLDPVFEGRIITIVSGATTTLTIINANGLSVGTGPINDWEITSKDLTDNEFARKIAAYPGTINDRRIRNIYPDQCEVTFTDDTDPAGLSGFYGGGDVKETVPGYYITAMEAGKRGTQRPGQPLTQFPGTGITSLLNPFGDVYGNGDVDLNDIVLDGGNYLMSQPIEDGEASAVRAITTDVSAVLKLEEQVTVQIDNFVRLLRKSVRKVLGRYNIDGPFFDLVSGQAQAVINKVKEDKDAKEIVLKEINEVPNKPDTFAMVFFFEAFVSGAKGDITVYI